MSKITNDGLTRSGTRCFTAVPIWQQWVSKGYVLKSHIMSVAEAADSSSCDTVQPGVTSSHSQVCHHHIGVMIRCDIVTQQGVAFVHCILDSSYLVVIISSSESSRLGSALNNIHTQDNVLHCSHRTVETAGQAPYSRTQKIDL